uniref:Mob1/phocein family protein n=1 Tax=Onchocerca volvulus TaxID=6282 RepID=A0A8R1TTB2_ONCVO
MHRLRHVDVKQTELLRYASATLGSGNLREAVKLPQGEDPNEWIAVNVLDFFNQVSMLFGTINDHCTKESCPKMCAGSKYEYVWSDGRKTIGCPAPVYIDYLMTWVHEQLDDENIFPSQIGRFVYTLRFLVIQQHHLNSGQPFPPNFLHIAQAVVKRLFRVYAHVYHQHLELIEQLNAVEHLNTSFKHFMLFIQEFDLIDSKQLVPLQSFIDRLTLEENSTVL